MYTRILYLIAALALVAVASGCAGATAGAPDAGASSTVSAPASPTPAGPAPTFPAPTARPTIVTSALPQPVISLPTALPPVGTAAPRATNASGGQSAPLPAATAIPLLTPVHVTPPSLESLRGSILFRSDRLGSSVQLFVMQADGSNQRLCDCEDLLQTLVNNEVISPDKQQFLFVKNTGTVRAANTEIWRHNNANNTDEPVTGGLPGFPGVDYAPVWSPDSKHIAWVSETNGIDEIYLYDASQNSNTRLTQSGGEWYKHPSFSPDGSHITFWTNLNDLNRKHIWVMNLDGSGKVNLSNNSYNDFDPIWVK